MSYYSDMKEGHKEFKEAQRGWYSRVQGEPAWDAERGEIRKVLDEGLYEEFLMLTVDDPELWSSFFHSHSRSGHIIWT